MGPIKRLMTAALLTAAAFAAGETAGSVTATKGLQLNGQAVPVAGTKSWPVGTGDVLVSDATPAVLTMKDGSKIVLGTKSQAKVENGTVRLLSGTMEYKLAERSTLQVAVKGDALTARMGVASTTGSQVAPVVSTSTATTEAVPVISRRKP
jgi:hypothetical protein